MASIRSRQSKRYGTRFVVFYREARGRQRNRTFATRAEAQEFADLVEVERRQVRKAAQVESALREIVEADGLTPAQRDRITDLLRKAG